MGKVTGLRGKRKKTLENEARDRNAPSGLGIISQGGGSEPIVVPNDPNSSDLNWPACLEQTPNCDAESRDNVGEMHMQYEDHDTEVMTMEPPNFNFHSQLSAASDLLGPSIDFNYDDSMSYSPMEFASPPTAPSLSIQTTTSPSSVGQALTPDSPHYLPFGRQQPQKPSRQTIQNYPQSHQQNHQQRHRNSAPPIHQNIPVTEPRHAPQRSESDSQCVVACAQLITTLENYVSADLKVLDIVLGLTRRASDNLIELVEQQQTSPSGGRCVALFGVIMVQIIDLLEAGSFKLVGEIRRASVDDSASAPKGLGASLMGASMGPFGGLANFQVDPQEQLAWQGRVVLKELHHAGDALMKVEALARTCPGPEAGSSGSARSSHNSSGGFAELAERLRTLTRQIEGSQ